MKINPPAKRKTPPGLLWGLAGIFLFLNAACSKAPPAVAAPSKPAVFVSTYPLRYFVQRLAGEEVEIFWLFPPGEDPAFWDPSWEEIVKIQSADLILFVGAFYEKWADYASLDQSKIRYTGEEFKESWIIDPPGESHSHGLMGEQSQEETAFTLWLDMAQAGIMAESVSRALAELLPEKKERIFESAAGLRKDLLDLHERYAQALAPLEGKAVLASHPVYQYFSRAYLPSLFSLLWEADVFPRPQEWAVLDALREENEIDLMLWEAEPSLEIQKALTRRGLAWVVVDPGFQPPGEGDFLWAMKNNAQRLKEALR